MTKKRLIVCCDGTWNRPDQLDRKEPAPTNVAKLAMALADQDDAGNPQIVHYQAGVGTRRWERLRGGGFGIGLSRNVTECYAFLVDHYEPGDELYFFGFSRGAFTARSTVGLVRNSGILRRENRGRIDEAYNLYRKRDEDNEPNGIAAQLFRRSHSHPEMEVQMVGVWDTVGALGIPIDGFRPPFLSKRWAFHDTQLSSRVRHAYHAVAIDERRGPFKPTLWVRSKPQPGQTLEQVWFAGVHCDVGGGYKEPELSEIPLLWMAAKARECDLVFKPDRLVPKGKEVDKKLRRTGAQVAPDPGGRLHNSRTKFYWLLPEHHRRLRGDGGAAVDGGSLASTARHRYESDRGYRPPGLKDWLDGDGDVSPVPDGT